MLPGNRVEVLVQGEGPGTYALRALEYDRGGVHPPVPEVVLANLVVGGERRRTASCRSRSWRRRRRRPGPSRQQRYFDFDQIAPEPDPVFAVNGMPFDPHVIVAQPLLGTTEEWTIVDVMSEEHPFHLHTNPFQVLAGERRSGGLAGLAGHGARPDGRGSS